MRRLVFALLLGLVVLPLPVHAQGSVTLTVCNSGTVDIEVFVSGTGTPIRPTTCVAVAQATGAAQPSHVGIAFTDSRGQWGAARRFDGVPYMGVKDLPAATKLAMRISGEPVPSPLNVLSLATRSETVRHGNANVSLPMQLLFQPKFPECRNVATGGGATFGNTTVIERATVCEELGYTLTVEAYPDSREISLGALPVGGFFSDGTLGATIIHEQSEVNWAQEEAARKEREGQPVNWSDLLPALRSVRYPRPTIRDVLPRYIAIRGTVASVEVDDTTQFAVVTFREAPPVPNYTRYKMCTGRLDILQERFGADFRTSMVGKPIEVRGNPGGDCNREIGINVLLAHYVRPVPSALFAADVRVWVPPPAAPPPPPPTPAEVEANNAANAMSMANVAYSQVELRAKGRLSAACGAQHETVIAANPGNRVAIDNEYFACRGAVNANARAEAQRGALCAQQIVGGDLERMNRDLDGTWQKIYDCAAASAPTPVAAAVPPPVTPAPAVVLPTPGSRLAVTPTARAGALPIASISPEWVGRSVIATGTVARVETIRGVEHVYFEGAGEKYVLCIREGMPMQHPSELVGKTLELSVRIDRACLDRRVTIGATELRQPTQLKIVGDSPAAAPAAAPPAPAPARVTEPVPTTTTGADGAAVRAKAVQEQQQRAAQERLAAQQKSAQEAKQRAQACMQELFKAHPDGGRSDPAGFQTGLLACAQIQQAGSAK